MNDDLKFIFANVNDWLKFAEAKNGGLLALNVATLIGLLQCNESMFGTFIIIRVLLIIAFCLSSAICVFSISPIVSKRQLFTKLTILEFNSQKANMDYIFFGNIAKLSPVQYQELVLLKLNGTLTNGEKDLCSQIVQNSEIALQKFKVFNFAAWITFLGFVTAMITVIMISIL